MRFYSISTYTYNVEHLRRQCAMQCHTHAVDASFKRRKKMYIRECLEQDWKWCAPWQLRRLYQNVLCFINTRFHGTCVNVIWLTPKKGMYGLPWADFRETHILNSTIFRPRIPNYSETGHWTVDRNFTHGTTICRKPHKSSNWYSCIPRQLGYKHIFCQNFM